MSAPAVPPSPDAPARTLSPGFILLVHFGSSSMTRACDPMLPALAESFGVSTGQAAITVSSYAIAYGVLQLFFGPVGDRWGKRRVIGYAALGCVVGNVLALAALNLEMLVVARVLSGATAAGIIPLVLAWIGDTVAYENRQAVLARFASASLTGMIAGQWVSGMLTDWLGWRSVFTVLAVLFCVGGVVIARHPDVRAEPVRPPTGQTPWHPMAQVLAIPWARWMLLMVGIEAGFAFSGIAFLPAFLVREYWLGLSAAAGIVALYGVGGLLYAATARRLVALLGEAGLALVAGLLVSASWLGIFAGHAWQAVVPATAIAGLGFYALHGVMQTHATQMAPAVRGTAVGLFAAGMFFGMSVGVALAALVVDHIGYRPLFLACSVAMGALAIVFSASLRRRAAAQRPAPTH